jgi:hypothetical protein
MNHKWYHKQHKVPKLTSKAQNVLFFVIENENRLQTVDPCLSRHNENATYSRILFGVVEHVKGAALTGHKRLKNDRK